MRLLLHKVICFETGLIIHIVSQCDSSLEMSTICPCIDIDYVIHYTDVFSLCTVPLHEVFHSEDVQIR